MILPVSTTKNGNKRCCDMKQEIEVFDYAKEIVSAIPKGVLLTTKNAG